MAGTAMADKISQAEALQAAQEFFASLTPAQAKSAQLTPSQATATLSLAEQGTGYYIFNREGGGYVVIAADDKARSTVLGYSGTATITASAMPGGMRDLLDTYSQELTATTATAAIKLSDIALLTTSDSRTDIEPMIMTQWGQDAPYSDVVVTLEGNTPDTPTGCGATATAQVMNFHQYPDMASGTGTVTLTNGDFYTLDLTNHTYDWDVISSLTDNTSYTDEQAQAVSNLMLDVGVALSNMYGDGGTGSYSYNMPTALIENFGYDRQTHMVSHDFHTTAEWDDMMYNELAEGRPVIYCADAIDDSHAFILDGYADGYYHVNWGWDGRCDGYFLLNALDPDEQGTGGASTGFFYLAQAMIGIQPPVDGNGDYTGLWSDGAVRLVCTDGNGKTGSYTFNGFYWNPHHASISIVPAVQIEDADGNTTWQKDIDNTQLTLELLDIERTLGTFSFATLDDGTYTVRPAYYDTTEETYHIIPVTYNTDSVATTITISGDELTCEAVTRGRNLTCNSFACDTPADSCYEETTYTFTANVTNNGDSYVYTSTQMVLYDTETNTEVTRSASLGYIILEPGETRDVGFFLTMPEAGTYTVLLIDFDNNVYYSDGTLTVIEYGDTDGVIDLLETNGSAVDITIYDTQGHMLLRQHATQADLSSLPSGIYIVKTPTKTIKAVKK